MSQSDTTYDDLLLLGCLAHGAPIFISELLSHHLLYIRLVVCLHDKYMSAFLTYCIFLEGFIMTEKKMKFEILGQTVFEILILLV